ncbi:S8 family peptidase [Clostridium sp. BJN0001]|uniref:S8 family peptidase n=1 Tax=Clostridium sp. BJN0001 TaxID=2930219 RepID=UPI001FD5E34A|nr:S8 family peptidase [Clostridium sp. BJN0001]
MAENNKILDKIDAEIGLLSNVPDILLDKILKKMKINSDNEKIEIIIMYRYSAQSIKVLVEELGGNFFDLDFNFAIVNIPITKIFDLAKINEIQYMELPQNLYESKITEETDLRQKEGISAEYNLTGKDVIVGFIDSGIDYMHPAFMDKEGNTRILYIYDLTNNAVYSKSDIDKAIKSDDPSEIVPENDTTGHGTHVAGEACAGGSIPDEYKGISEEAYIIMVKSGRGNWVLASNIMKGLKFLIDKSKEVNMPIVVNISLSTNNGLHNGSSLLEQYISAIANLERVTIVVAAGNEGDAGHYTSGIIKNTQVRSFNISSDENLISINMYKSVLPNASINIIGPGGQKSGFINISQGYYSGNISSDRYSIFISGPKPFNLVSQIQIMLTPIVSDYLVKGTWKIEVKSDGRDTGVFYIWLPVLEGINPKTRFLDPVQTNTLGIPATVENVISVGSYNSLTNTLSTFTGRGRESLDLSLIKPDIVAPGENIIGPLNGGGYGKKTGTSMAAAQVSGICGLFSQWGIVDKNDLYLYGQRLKYYLAIGANRDRANIIYPNVSWGYGAICALSSFRILLDDQLKNIRSISESTNIKYVNFKDIRNYTKKIKKLEIQKEGFFYRFPRYF